MAEERVQRRLAAILAADVVGYSKMMGKDEAGTLSRLKSLRAEFLHPKIAEYGGRIVKTTGDGTLIEFGSAVNAVSHAIDVQRGMAQRNANLPDDQRIHFRLGINVGDIIIDGDDIFGDGVNVAARLETIAEPGGICISARVHDYVGDRLDISFDDLGPKSVKNIAEPVHVYQIRMGGTASATGSEPAVPPPLPDRPAVAVLPFQNMSRDLEQEYFADGLTEDIITALSLYRTFPVIARNSTFSFKGQSPDLRKVGRELGARYIVEGSVRKAADKVRVTAQLIDAETGHHVWSHRYDRQLTDIFELQDEITDQIAAIIEPTIEQTEQNRIVTKPPNDFAAWEYWLKGYSYIYEETKAANAKARELFIEAIRLDPNYARAHTGLAFTYGRDMRFWPPEKREDWEEWKNRYSQSARRAVELDGNDSEARTLLARVYLLEGEPDAAIAEARRAVELNPHRAWSNNILGHVLARAGHFEEAIPWIERALKLNPLDPRRHLLFVHLALAHLGAGNYEKAVECAHEAIRQHGASMEASVYLASALGFLERNDEALQALQPFEEQAWEWVKNHAYWLPKTRNQILEGLRKANLPE